MEPNTDQYENIAYNLALMCTALQDEKGRAASRELSIAITNMETARLWILEHKRKQDEADE